MHPPNHNETLHKIFKYTTRQFLSNRSKGVSWAPELGGWANSEKGCRKNPQQFRVFQPNLRGPKEGWGVVSSYKSETSHQLLISSTFQNGEHLQPQWYLEEGGLHGQTQSQRRLSDSSYSLRTQVVPQVYLPGETFSVQDTSLWLGQSTSCVHKTPDASGFNPQGFRYPSYSLYWRYPDHGQLPHKGIRKCSDGNPVTREPRDYHQLEEECSGSKSNNGIPGATGRFNFTTSQCPRQQILKIGKESRQKTEFQGETSLI